MQEVRPVGETLTYCNPTVNATLVLLLSVGAMVSGTAGTYPIAEMNSPEIRQFRFPIQESRPVAPRRKELAPSVGESLSKIRDVFGLRMSEVSQIFGVSRRAAYDWLEGATPKPEIVAKIYQLSTVAESFQAEGINSIRHFIHRPVLGERTLIELLKTGDSLDRAIEIIRATALEEAQARRPLSKRVHDTSGLDEESTPIGS